MIRKASPVSGLKALSDGRFSGIAWSFATVPDAQGDVLLPSALTEAAKAARVPVMVEHAGEPVGAIELAEVGADGLMVEGRLNVDSPAGRAAYAKAKSGEYGGLSIGFSGEAETSGPVRIFRSVALAEVSICRQPVNTGSRVTAIKSWSEVETPVDLERLLRGSGMPGRLAARVAAAAWPAIQKSEPEPANPELQAALRRLARV